MVGPQMGIKGGFGLVLCLHGNLMIATFGIESGEYLTTPHLIDTLIDEWNWIIGYLRATIQLTVVEDASKTSVFLSDKHHRRPPLGVRRLDDILSGEFLNELLDE